ncbi:MAG TPA: hypothetical protein IAB65_05460 [Candidatus Onthocola stercorigallinarum]|nr:hypothetical protein [Candidatus Onthocola stercorigallinarum]
MAKLNNVLYLTDDYIYLKNKKKDKLIKYKINSGIIEYGKIYNIDKFIKVYEKILKDNNLNNNLLGDTIKIIVSPNYTPADITLLKKLFERFNYRKIVVDNEIKTYKLNNNNCYLNVFDNFMNLSFIDEYKKINSFIIYNNYFLTIDKLLSSIKDRIQNKEIILLGHGDFLQKIFDYFENKYDNKTYIFTNFETYLIDNN